MLALYAAGEGGSVITTSAQRASVRHNADWSGVCEVTWTDDQGARFTVRMPATDFRALCYVVAGEDIRERFVQAMDGAVEGLL